MLTTRPLLNPKGLLAAMVAAIVSGQALADVAGRVNFVAGEVVAVSTDGSSRMLSRGDLVNSGERLETGRGRVQIRFTDGSFISLQPNTVFGLDNYSYAKDKPNDGSLLFNFVRGGMRTISGAIGKVNRASYKIKTPVATIGIRGTGYAGTMNNGKLVVSVSKGMVNLTNDFGSSNVPAGQTFQTQAGKAPEPAPAGVTAQARANAPSAGQQQEQQEQQEQRTNRQTEQRLDNSVASNPLDNKVIEAVNDAAAANNAAGSLGNGNTPNPQPTPQPEVRPLFPNSVITINPSSTNGSIEPFYAFASASGQTGVLANGELGVQYKDTLGSERNAIVKMEELSIDKDEDISTVEKHTVFDVGSLKSVNIQNKGGITFGEWTNGSGKLDAVDLTLNSGTFIPYIVGLQANTNNDNSKVTFRLDAATAARNGSQSGTLDHFNLSVNYAKGLIDVDMKVLFNGDEYIVNQQGIHRFAIDNSGGSELNVFAQGKNCIAGGCPTDIGFFFSGLSSDQESTPNTQVGSSYKIDLSNSSSITGVAALLLNPNATQEFTPSASQPDTDHDPVFAAAFTTNNSTLPLTLHTTNATLVSGKFDPTTGELLLAANASSTYGRANLDTSATTINAGSHKKVLAWGQWTGGTINHPKFSTGIDLTGDNLDVHYIIGLPTSATDILKTTGSVVYAMVGGSAPQVKLTDTQGYLSQTGSLFVNFANNGEAFGTAQLKISLTGFDQNAAINPAALSKVDLVGNIDLNRSAALQFNNLSVTANNGSLSCVSCTGTAGGSFFGGLVTPANTADQVPTAAGVGYTVTGTASNLNNDSTTGFSIGGTIGFGNPKDDKGA